MQISLRGGVGAVWIHHHEGRAAPLGLHGVAHHVDLGIDRIAAPDHDQVGVLADLPQVHAALGPDARRPAGVGQGHADRREVARVAHGVGEPVDAIPLDQAHGARVVVRPHRLEPEPGGLAREGLRDQVERVVPRDPLEAARALRPHPPQRVAAGGPDGARARRSGRPSRRSPRACRCCGATRVRGRWCGDRGARPPARRCWCSRGGTPRARSRSGSRPWPPAYPRGTMRRWGPRSDRFPRASRAGARDALAPPARCAGRRGPRLGAPGGDAARPRPGRFRPRRPPCSSGCSEPSPRSALAGAPISGPVGLWLSRMLAAGDRAWYVRPDAPRAGDRHGPPRPAPHRGGVGPRRRRRPERAADPRAAPRRRRARAAGAAAALIRLRPRSA